MTQRVIAQRVLTGEFLSWDVPLGEPRVIRELGAGGVYGKIGPKTLTMTADDGQPLLDEWSTALYYEADGQIRAGGIVTHLGEDENGSLAVEAPGFTTYPFGTPYLGVYKPGLGADPLDVVREVWSHVQSFPDADLGVSVDPDTSGEVLDDLSDPDKPKPFVLGYWQNRDCGQLARKMLDLAPADAVMQHTWNDDHTAISHHLKLGSPRIGRRRHDLRFVEGENITKVIPVRRDGSDFAQTVVALGRGEGRRMVRATVSTRDGRLRRVATVVDKHAGWREAKDLARREHRHRTTVTGFDKVHVRDHANASSYAIQPGDDIRVEADPRWFGRMRLWVRVMAIEHNLDGHAVLYVTRADEFR